MASRLYGPRFDVPHTLHHEICSTDFAAQTLHHSTTHHSTTHKGEEMTDEQGPQDDASRANPENTERELLKETYDEADDQTSKEQLEDESEALEDEA